MSKKTLGLLAICVGLVGAVGTSYLTVMSTFWDGLPGNGPQDHFAAQHPLRWMAMNAGFWISLGLIASGLFVMLRNTTTSVASEEAER